MSVSLKMELVWSRRSQGSFSKAGIQRVLCAWNIYPLDSPFCKKKSWESEDMEGERQKIRERINNSYRGPALGEQVRIYREIWGAKYIQPSIWNRKEVFIDTYLESHFLCASATCVAPQASNSCWARGPQQSAGPPVRMTSWRWSREVCGQAGTTKDISVCLSLLDGPWTSTSKSLYFPALPNPTSFGQLSL